MTAEEIVAGIESGKIPVGYLYRRKVKDSRGKDTGQSEWQWYDRTKPEKSDKWTTASFAECCERLMGQS